MAEEKQPSETVPGGRYIQGEFIIDANGLVLGKANENQKETGNEKAAEDKEVVTTAVVTADKRRT